MRWPKLLAALIVTTALGYGARFVTIGSSVGAGYAAHVTCSLWFVSGLPAEQSFDEYVQHEVWPLGPALGIEVGDAEVVAKVFGKPRARAVYQPGGGCTQLHANQPVPPPPPIGAPRPHPELAWPQGDAGPPGPAAPALEAALDRAFAEPANDPGSHRFTKAVVIVRDGEIQAERYAPGVDAATPLLSWSMAKGVLASLYGVAEAQGRLSRAARAPVLEWRSSGDPRQAITLDQLLRMSSGLAFDERYGATNEASVMLFARADSAAYAAQRRLDAPPDSVWSYSSGTANILARALARTVARRGDLRKWAREQLFERIGAHSALMEVDAAGTPLLSSFVYMTARDWARLGELHRQDGVWLGERVLPAGWVTYVTTPTPASNGEYGAHWWLNRGTLEAPETPNWPALPRDAFAAQGYSGQYVMVVPSERLVVVRLGLSTPDDANDGTQELVADVIAHFRDQPGRD